MVWGFSLKFYFPLIINMIIIYNKNLLIDKIVYVWILGGCNIFKIYLF